MSNQQSEYNIVFKTSDPSILVNLFGKELPAEGAEISIDPDVTIKVQSVNVQHGLVDTSIIVNFVLQIISGITIKVIGDLLVDRFKDKKAELTINGKKIENMNSSEIISALNDDRDA